MLNENYKTVVSEACAFIIIRITLWLPCASFMQPEGRDLPSVWSVCRGSLLISWNGLRVQTGERGRIRGRKDISILFLDLVTSHGKGTADGRT